MSQARIVRFAIPSQPSSGLPTEMNGKPLFFRWALPVPVCQVGDVRV